MAQLAAHIRRRRTDGDEADGGEDETIVMDDDCVVSTVQVTLWVSSKLTV